MHFYCYVLKSSKTGAYYIGSTRDIESRLSVHNAGRNRSTKSGAPWEVAGYRKYATRSAAFKEEQRLKGMKSRKRIEAWLETATTD